MMMTNSQLHSHGLGQRRKMGVALRLPAVADPGHGGKGGAVTRWDMGKSLRCKGVDML